MQIILNINFHRFKTIPYNSIFHTLLQWKRKGKSVHPVGWALCLAVAHGGQLSPMLLQQLKQVYFQVYFTLSTFYREIIKSEAQKSVNIYFVTENKGWTLWLQWVVDSFLTEPEHCHPSLRVQVAPWTTNTQSIQTPSSICLVQQFIFRY